MKYIPPSAKDTAFNCPHCGALTTQFWYAVRLDKIEGDQPLPLIVLDDSHIDYTMFENSEHRKEMKEFFNRAMMGLPFTSESGSTIYNSRELYNVNVSKCFNCKELALWIFNRLVYPTTGEAPPPNPDLPSDILADYQEASSILDLSPRGAAALVRLCIQKLCKELGQPGKNINDDIKALVAAGLDPRIQRALDAVRVIGNNAVHPGSMDLTDDRATAESLFRLLNLIAEKMISEAKHVDEVYALLPPGARAAIDVRDGKEE